MSTGSGRSWFVCHRPRRSPRHRLFCFPYAGGGASVFRNWELELPDDVELCAVQPPGRETRLLEPAFKRIGDLVSSLEASLPPLLDLPFSFFGHSMGAYIAFELAHELRRRGQPQPRHLFLSGGRAPQIPDDEPPIHPLPEAEFVNKLIERYEGIPPEVLENRELMELVLPGLKADIEVVETYRHPEGAEPLGTAIVCLGGSDDKRVSREHLTAWEIHTRGPFEVHVFPGDHFYLRAQRSALLRVLNRELARSEPTEPQETESGVQI